MRMVFTQPPPHHQQQQRDERNSADVKSNTDSLWEGVLLEEK